MSTLWGFTDGVLLGKGVHGLGFRKVGTVHDLGTYPKMGCPEFGDVCLTLPKPVSIFLGTVYQSLKLEGAGKCSIIVAVNEPTVFESHLIRVRIDESVANPVFVYYFFNSPFGHKYIMTIVEQVAAAGLRASDLVKLKVPCPNIEIQNKSAYLLKMIDDKIALNQQINKNLEEQAQAIFAEFLANHELSSVTVEDVILTANTGADAIQKAPIVAYDTGVRCVRVGDMSNQRPVHEWGFTQVTPEIFKQYQLHKDDIVITRTASLGLNRLIGKDLNAVYNNGLIRITVNQDIIYPLILFCQFQTDDYRNYISRINSETSVRPNMKINYLLKYEFDIPHISEQVKLKNILQPIFVAQENNISENQALSSIRDALLPRLMSGEIDVSKIEI